MKKNYYSMLVAMIIVTSCLSKTMAVTFYAANVKADLTKTIDDINAAFKAKDAKTVLSYYAEDGLFCGTDPTEFWDKATYSKMITEMLADKTMTFDMTLDKREIRIGKDGNSAIVIGQFATEWSKPILVRSTMHLVKADDKWVVDFSSLALIPDNKDLPKIIGAVK